MLIPPVTFALEVGEARIPRTGQLVWDGNGAPEPTEAEPTEPEPPETQVESPERFADALALAFRAGDVSFLAERLNPAVIELYGREQCVASLGPDPSRAFGVVSVSELEPYDYNPDGLSIPIGEAYTVIADVTADGATLRRELHFAPVGDLLTWFTDCGEPLATN